MENPFNWRIRWKFYVGHGKALEVQSPAGRWYHYRWCSGPARAAGRVGIRPFPPGLFGVTRRFVGF